MRTVLFLCTGNYYRSRFAEELFNHLAAQGGLDWRADSSGLALERGDGVNVGPISTHALAGLEERSIPIGRPIRWPRTTTSREFVAADRVIALKEDEHRPLMRTRFPEWENRITYWHVHDLDQWPREQALAEIETLVRELIAGLRA